MKILVTGLAGFAGRHLTDRLLASGHEVAGLALPVEVDTARALFGDELELHTVDILDADGLREVFTRSAPQGVAHLAGVAHVGQSWHKKKITFETNTVGTWNVLQAALEIEPKPRVLVVGSADTYGIVPEAEQPITEERPLRPQSPYAASKAAAEILALQTYLGEGLPVILSRSFNHIGRGQSPTFALSNFARQVALIEAGRAEPLLSVGNLSARRDFTDVRDTVIAYEALLLEGRPGEIYNVAAERAVALEELVDVLRKLSRVPFEVRPEADRMRPVDMPLLLGSAAKIRKELGWRAAITLDETMAWTLDDWREKI